MPASRPRRVPLLLAVLLGLCLWLATTGTAQAHTGLRESSPAEGSTLTEAPAAVTLTFSAAVRGPEVTVTGPDGVATTTAPASVDGSTVTVPVALVASGGHTVAWAVTSADGHRLEGTVAFTFAPPVTALPTPPTTSAPSSAAPPTTPQDAEPSEAAASTEEDGGSGTAAVVAVVVVLLAAGAGGAVVGRRRGDRQAGASGSGWKSR